MEGTAADAENRFEDDGDHDRPHAVEEAGHCGYV